jgi:hypothetical protein
MRSARWLAGFGALVALGMASGCGGDTPAAPSPPVTPSPPAAALKLAITAPLDGATVIGSPSHGFTIAPVVAVGGGTGVASVWADTAKGPVDLGTGDGSIPVLLDGVGTDFPHAAVTVTVHARDAAGVEAAATIQVVPSNVKVRFERATGGAAAPLSSLDVLSDGRPLLGFAGSYYLLDAPSSAAQPSLVLDRVDALRRSGERLFFTTHDAAQTTERLVVSTLTGKETTLVTLSTVNQVMAFDPFVRASGHVYAAWVNTDTLESHVLGYTPEGALEFDTLHAASPLLDQVAETPDGRLLTVAAPETAVSFVQPFNAQTGVELPAWAPPGGQLILVDDKGVALLYYTSKSYGTPAIHVASFDPTGTLQWDEIVDETYPQLVRRLPSGDLLAYLFGAGVGVPSSLRVLGKTGQTPLWTGTLDETNYLIGSVPDSTDLLVSRFNTTTSTLSAMRLTESGMVAWVAPLPGDANTTLQVLADGSVLASALDAKTKTVTSALVSPDGKAAWSASFPGEKVLGVIEADDLLIFAASSGDLSPFRFEARRRATGALSWRHVEGPSPQAFGRWIMAESKPWGVVLGSLVRAASDAKGASNTTVTLGFVP